MDQVSCYVPLDAAAAVNEHGQSIAGGETCRVDALKDTFAWMRGFMNGWYGWASDGKSLTLDYLSVLKAKRDGWKFCMYKPENMDVVIESGKAKIKANRIYKNLAWTLTGKTWDKNFSIKYKCPMMALDEEMEALDFITSHFFIVYSSDRTFKNLMDQFRFIYDKYGVDAFVLDPWYKVILPDGRGDYQLSNAFTEIKEFALLTNSSFNIVNHARSMNGSDQKQNPKDPNSPYKVVNQFMQLGGSPWDNCMDGQFSIYRPNRHNKPNDTAMEFYCLKQRDGEIVGTERGEAKNIYLERTRRQYIFNGINPMDGTLRFTDTIDFTQPKVTDEVPF